MISASEVSCVIVTRGDVDLAEIKASLPFRDVLIWDNSKLIPPFRMVDTDEKVWGRYLGVAKARNKVIAVQDDDVVVEDWDELLAGYEPGVVVCNMGPGHRAFYEPMRISLVGFGAIFDRSLIDLTFERYFDFGFVSDELFRRECDRVFTGLNQLKILSVPYRNLPHEQTTERMWREPRHGADLQEILRRIDTLRPVHA